MRNQHLGFLSEEHAHQITKKAREVLREYYSTHSLDAFQSVADMLETLQDHGVSPKELPIMNEMREVIIRL